jgi:tRNA A37 threonylcarbamoyladenosine modification protein TsaB
MNFLIIDGTSKKINFFSHYNNYSYSQFFESSKNNFEQFAVLLFNFIEKNKILLKKMNNIFINEGPGNFSGIRTSIAVSKGISITRKISLFGFNTFDLCSCNINIHTFALIQKNEKEFFIKEYNQNNKEEKGPKIISFQELGFYKNNKKIFINLDKINKKRIEETCKKNNVDFKEVNYMNILLLYKKNLITKKLIKPLYIS